MLLKEYHASCRESGFLLEPCRCLFLCRPGAVVESVVCVDDGPSDRPNQPYQTHEGKVWSTRGMKQPGR